MYRIKDAATGALIDELIAPKWVRKQMRVDMPILCDSIDDAEGVVLSDNDTIVAIKGSVMDTGNGAVVIERIDSDPYLFNRIEKLEADLSTTQEKLNTLDQQTTALMLGMTDIFSAILEGGAK